MALRAGFVGINRHADPRVSDLTGAVADATAGRGSTAAMRAAAAIVSAEVGAVRDSVDEDDFYAGDANTEFGHVIARVRAMYDDHSEAL